MKIKKKKKDSIAMYFGVGQKTEVTSCLSFNQHCLFNMMNCVVYAPCAAVA